MATLGNIENTSHPQPISLRESSPKDFAQRSLIGDAARRFARNRLAIFGLIIAAGMLFLAVFADVIAPYPYDAADLTQPANALPFTNPAHPLGTDNISRDYLTRLIYGARTSMLVGLSVPLIAFTIGITLGALSGYRGGAIDFFLQRLVEVVTAIPPLLLALFVLSVTGASIINVILILSATSWLDPLRMTRAQFLAFRERDFVLAARALGASDIRIALTHILPNALSPLLVQFTLAVPLAIFAEAGLSFLGLGITEPTASWGKMVGAGVGSSIQVYYHLALFPTIAVALTMLSFSFIGDGLQEALNPEYSR